ncbi:transposase [Streptococcus pneumoniae]|nr:transposase [Streptococcus pneumoniae]
MEQLHFITKLLDIKDPNIQILDIINKDTHKEIIAKLDYDAPSCPECGNQLKKYDFQKPSKIPYLETTGMPTRILLRKRRFKCYHCSKMMVSGKIPSQCELSTLTLVLLLQQSFTIRKPSSLTRRCSVRLPSIAEDSLLLPPVGVWAVSQSQCGRSPSQVGYVSSPW